MANPLVMMIGGMNHLPSVTDGLQDRKKMAVELIHEGYSVRRAATLCGLSKSAVHRLLKACSAHSGQCYGAFLRTGVLWHSNPSCSADLAAPFH